MNRKNRKQEARARVWAKLGITIRNQQGEPVAPTDWGIINEVWRSLTINNVPKVFVVSWLRKHVHKGVSVSL